jgi:hypothetical protein
MTDTSKPAVIQCVGLAVHAGQPDPAGQYLQSYDPEAHGGRGHAEWTPDLASARVFPAVEAAFECWRAVPVCAPYRADGQPNRPLTAYSVTFTSPLPAAFRGEGEYPGLAGPPRRARRTGRP